MSGGVAVRQASDLIAYAQNFLGRNERVTTPYEENAAQFFRDNIQRRARSLAKACYLRITVLSSEKNTALQAQKARLYFQAFNYLLDPKYELTEKQLLALFKNYMAQLASVVDSRQGDKHRKKAAKGIIQAEPYIVHDDSYYREPLVARFGDDEDETAVTYRVTRPRAVLPELQRLHIAPNAAWRRKIKPWEQQLLAQLPAEHPALVEKTPTSSTKPGMSNLGRDELVIGTGETTKRSALYYQSTASKHTQEEATAALSDFFATYHQQMIQDFITKHPQAAAGEDDNGLITIPILMESLLTPAWYDHIITAFDPNFADSNSRMLAFKAEAIQRLREQITQSGGYQIEDDDRRFTFTIIDNNQPLNGRRTHTGETALCPRRLRKGFDIAKGALRTILNYDAGLINDNGQPTRFHNQLTALDRHLDSARKLRDSAAFERILDTIPAENYEKYALFVETLKAYADAWRQGEDIVDHHNHPLYLATCETILTQESGGAAKPNCKSTKDRGGLLKAMNSFFRICSHKWGMLPKYGQSLAPEQQAIRDQYICTIPGMISDQMSPGAPGMKNEGSKLAFASVLAVRDIFWWKDNYLKTMPEFFRRAGDSKRDLADRFLFAMSGLACLFLPMFAGPFVRMLSYQAMVPTAVAETDEFKARRLLAKTNKLRAKALKPDSYLGMLSNHALQQVSSDMNRLAKIKDPSYTSAAAAINVQAQQVKAHFIDDNGLQRTANDDLIPVALYGAVAGAVTAAGVLTAGLLSASAGATAAGFLTTIGTVGVVTATIGAVLWPVLIAAAAILLGAAIAVIAKAILNQRKLKVKQRMRDSIFDDERGSSKGDRKQVDGLEAGRYESENAHSPFDNPLSIS
jgi:hypothetical protein